ncbi:putative 7-carboxy-7-deazaguanine synthase QueE [Abyssisolibacter fermentans]|uniref:putative 7-carboxy-7-deazaguanine synthase QueE n=1 Tax=Abyssisolibacter fermentans TaxID=1766203 RepID=UPI00082B6F4B|nr:putative 7-carboxy-7-deazaguanine synthase QueE [Abyssisolibacter fermentans]
MLNIAEKFISINGEGKLCGQLAVFIRFAGCNLDCSYCDTDWARDKNSYTNQMSVDEIYDYIKSTKVKNVTLTGGEPLLQEGIKELLKVLSDDEEIHVEIETNGSVSLAEFLDLNRKQICYTLDYKLPYSGMEEFMNMNNFDYITKNDVVKFVVSGKKDLDRALEIVNKYDLVNLTNVYFSSVFGSIDAQEIVDFMKDNKLNGVNLQLQLHKIIWSPEKRGV